ncbi:MAG TPA: hypothetical protein VHD88_06330 [Pyrinomonadaceae bacterium]|nr:hypothetical protein [Pyrinomonadaceae bacterium]
MRKLATYEGVVENGQVKLPPNTDIPEKTRVYVLVPDVEAQKTLYIASPRLVHPDQAKDFEKQIVEETTDASL